MRSDFSGKERIYQTLGVTGMLGCGGLFFLSGWQNPVYQILCLFGFLLCFLEFYVRLGDTMFGPHQFIFGFLDLVRAVRPKQSATEDRFHSDSSLPDPESIDEPLE